MFRKYCKILTLNEIGVFAETVGTVPGADVGSLASTFGPKVPDVCELNSCGDVKSANMTTVAETLPILGDENSTALREAALAAATAHSDAAMKTAIDQLIKWQNGFTSEKIEIRKGKFGWGVHAREDLDEGFEVVNIARQNEITVERAVEFIGIVRFSV